MNIEALLPWQPVSAASGFTKLDVELVIDDTFGKLTVRRQTPREPQHTNFAVYHNDTRISGLTHTKRPDALAEAERYFYAQPQFAKSNNAVLLNVAIQNGRDACRAGKSIYDNPNQRQSVDHNHWASGWMQEAFKEPMAKMQAALESSLSAGVTATTRANTQLEEDLRITTSRLAAFAVVGEFMDKLNDTAAADFFRDFRSGDVDLMSKKWPGWSDFLFKKKLGPPIDNADPPA